MARAGSRVPSWRRPAARNQTATAVTTTPTASRRSPWPVEESRRVPRGASMRAFSARNRAIPPATVRVAATASSTLAPEGRTRPVTARPVTATPTSMVSPA